MEQQNPVCPKCGGPMQKGSHLEASSQNSPSCYWRHDRMKVARVHPFACLKCGFVELYVDPEEIKG